MKANEFIYEAQQGTPEVFLDMDGVLADFFAEYAKLAGVTSGSYRDIPPAKADPTLDKMVGTDFFARLPKFPTADSLVDMVVHVFGHYNICSSPLRGDHEGSAKYKKIWISEHLNPQPQQILIVSNKAKYAVQPDGTPNVLIDDRGSNVSAWEAAGGVAIKYQADEDSLAVIQKGLKRAFEIIRGQRKLKPQQLVSKERNIPVATDKDEQPTSAANIAEKWSQKYKKSINCSNPKGFSQKAHCASRKKHTNEATEHCDVKNAVPELKAALTKRKAELRNASDRVAYDKIDKIMTRVAKAYNITGHELHNMWTKKYGEIPDTWVLDEGKIANAALVAMLASTLASQPAFSEPNAIAKALNIAKQINNMKGYGPEAAQEEAQQELMNLIRALGNQDTNNSKVYPLIKDMVKTPGPLPTNVENLPQLTNQPTNENFADGKGPGRPGDSQRHGIPKKATKAELEKASHASGRKGQLARWQLNMRNGKNK